MAPAEPQDDSTLKILDQHIAERRADRLRASAIVHSAPAQITSDSSLVASLFSIAGTPSNGQVVIFNNGKAVWGNLPTSDRTSGTGRKPLPQTEGRSIIPPSPRSGETGERRGYGGGGSGGGSSTVTNITNTTVGLTQTETDALYVPLLGGTMTGPLSVNLSTGTVGLKVLQTVSGSIIKSDRLLATSGSLIVDGAAIFKSTIRMNGVTYTLPFSDGTSSGKVLKTNSAGQLSWSDDNNSGGSGTGNFGTGNVITIVSGTALRSSTGSLKTFFDANYLRTSTGSLQTFFGGLSLRTSTGALANAFKSIFLGSSTGALKSNFASQFVQSSTGSLKTFFDANYFRTSTGALKANFASQFIQSSTGALQASFANTFKSIFLASSTGALKANFASQFVQSSTGSLRTLFNTLYFQTSTGSLKTFFDANYFRTSTGALQTRFDSRYLKSQGGTMTGSLTVNLSSGTVGLKVIQTISGSTIKSDRLLATSGSLIVDGGAIFKSTLKLNGVTYTFPTSDGSASGKVLKTNSAGQLSWSADSTSTSAVGQGIRLLNSAIALNSTISGTTLKFQTVSGSILKSDGPIAASGSITVDGPAIFKSTIRMNGVTYTLPFSDGSASGKVLKTNSAGQLSWSADLNTGSATAGQGIRLLNGAIALSATISGTTLKFQTVSGSIVKSDGLLAASGSLIVDGAATLKSTLKIGGVTYTFPTSDGSASGKVLKTDSAGHLSWSADNNSGGGSGNFGTGNVVTIIGGTALTSSTGALKSNFGSQFIQSSTGALKTAFGLQFIQSSTGALKAAFGLQFIQSSTGALKTAFHGQFVHSSTGSLKTFFDANYFRTSTGALQTRFDSRYLKSQGGTMTGALTMNLSSGTVGLKVIQTISGSTIKSDRLLATSGSLIVDGGAIFKSTLKLNGVTYTFPYSDGSASGKVLKTNSAGQLSWSADSTSTSAVGQGIQLLNSAIALNSSISGSTLRFQTMSGTRIHAQDTLNSSGNLIIRKLAGTSTGLLLTIDTKGLVYNATTKNVGIGSASPSQALMIAKGGSDPAIYFALQSAGGTTVAGSASSAGPNAGGTFATVDNGTSDDWQNPGNAATSDNVYATRTGSNPTDYLKATNFGFSIPTGATITGIVVTWERKDPIPSNTVKDNKIRIVKGGTIGSTDKADTSTTYTNSDVTATYPASATNDLWGETWTASDINDSTFGAALAASTGAASVDYTSITVYYTTADVTTGGTVARDWTIGANSSTYGRFMIAQSGSLSGKVFVTVTETGSVGIGRGLTSPGSKLSLSGAMIIGNNLGTSAADAGLSLEVIGTASGRTMIGWDNVASGTGTGLIGKDTIFTTDAFNNPALYIRSTETTGSQDIFRIVTDVSTTGNKVFRINASGATFADQPYSSGGADYAEWFYADPAQKLSAGEDVCIDVLHPNSVKRCVNEADPNVMGIVSTKPSFVGNSRGGVVDAVGVPLPGYVLVGLIGQIPAKVIVESGAIIEPGDSLTPSAIPGIARKAQAGEPTVGVALEGLASGRGTINVLVARKNSSLTAETISDRVLQTIKDLKIDDDIKAAMQRSMQSLATTNAFMQPVRQEITRQLGTLHLAAPGADATNNYAEWFSVLGTPVSIGDVLCSYGQTARGVEVCAHPGDHNALGVVVSDATFIGNDQGEFAQPVLVALFGQVTVNASAQGHRIRAGDPLAVSSDRGFVRRANKGEASIGVAVDPLPVGTGPIHMSLAHTKASLLLQALTQDALDHIATMPQSSALEAIVSQAALRTATDATIADQEERLNAVEAMVTASSSSLASQSSSSSVASVASVPPRPSGPNLTLSGALSADTLDIQHTLSVGRDARIAGDLYLEGIFNVRDLYVPGMLQIDGALTSSTLALSSGAVIHGPLTVYGPLNLASVSNLRIASGSSLDLSNIIVRQALHVVGSVTIEGLADFLGDVQIGGELSVSARQAGFATIPQSGTAVTIFFSPPFHHQPVVTASPDIPLLYAVSFLSSTGFTIRISPAALEPVTFSWFAVGTNATPGAQSADSSASSASSLSSDASSATSQSSGSGTAFPVDPLGVPLSSDSGWNSCIRNYPLIQSDGSPIQCGGYHDGYVWEHPDLHISFTYNTSLTPPYLSLPPGYLPVTISSAHEESSSSMSSSQESENSSSDASVSSVESSESASSVESSSDAHSSSSDMLSSVSSSSVESSGDTNLSSSAASE